MPNRGKGGYRSIQSASTSPSNGIKPSKQILEQIERTTSLTPIEMMFMRAVKDGGETAQSLESMDLEYLLKIDEYLTIQNDLEADIHRQIEARNKGK